MREEIEDRAIVGMRKGEEGGTVGLRGEIGVEGGWEIGGGVS